MRDDRRMVLVVEDDPPLRRMIGIFLRAAGYLVCAAEDGSRGLALARDERPDLMLLDLMLPGLDGWEVLRRIKGDALTAAIPVLVLTASADPPVTQPTPPPGAPGLPTQPLEPPRAGQPAPPGAGPTAGPERHTRAYRH